MKTVVSVATGRGMKEGAESEGGLRRATPSQPASGPEKMLSSGGPGQVTAPTGTMPTLVPSSGSLPLPLFASQQAAMAAGLFRASMGSLGNGPLPLPALMASLQAAAGVGVGVGVLPLPLRPPGMSLLGPGSGFTAANLFPMSQQSALLNWSKLAQTNATLGVTVSQDSGLGSLLQHSPDSSNRPPSSKGYNGGLLVHGTQVRNDLNNHNNIERDKIREGKPVVTRRTREQIRETKERRLEMERREAMDKVNREDKKIDIGRIDVDPQMSSPVGTSSPPSNGSSGGKSAESSGRKSRTGGLDSSRDKVFSCSICHRTFGYKHVLQNHERTHTGEKPFECKQCGKRFTRDHHLKTHMRLHTGEKPYNCTHCDRQFVQVANLRRHLRVHTGERPYACEMCTSRFSDSNQLKAHMLIHKGEKPFECDQCGGRFRRRHHLMHHKCPKDNGDVLLKPKRARITKSIMKDDVDTDAESEPPPTPSSYGMTSDDLLDVHDDDEVLQHAGSRLLGSRIQNQVRNRSRTPSILTASSDGSTLGYGPQLLTQQEKKRERKPRETRRVIRLTGPRFGGPSAALITSVPEQTEPEDLSMTSTNMNQQSRMRHASTFSVGSTGGWSAAGSISVGLASEDDDMSDNDIVQRPAKRHDLGRHSNAPIDLVRNHPTPM